jgi:hypothetical protein
MIAIVVNVNRKNKKLIQFVTFFQIYPCFASDLEPEPHLVAATAPASPK